MLGYAVPNPSEYTTLRFSRPTQAENLPGDALLTPDTAPHCAYFRECIYDRRDNHLAEALHTSAQCRVSKRLSIAIWNETDLPPDGQSLVLVAFVTCFLLLSRHPPGHQLLSSLLECCRPSLAWHKPGGNVALKLIWSCTSPSRKSAFCEED